LNFDQGPSLLDVDIFSLTFASDETVDLVEMTTEGFVSVDNGEAACVPTDLTVLSVPVPKRFSDKKVVVFNLSSERGRRNVEESVSSVEVVEIPRHLVAGNLPRWVFSVGVELVFEVSPGFVESLNGFVVGLLTHGDD
jgi:hypothetical protein